MADVKEKFKKSLNSSSKIETIVDKLLDLPPIEAPLKILGADLQPVDGTLEIANLDKSIERRNIGFRDRLRQKRYIDANGDGLATIEESKNYKGDVFVNEGPFRSPVFSSSEIYPERSDDRFYIQYENPSLAGQRTIEVDLNIYNPLFPNGEYNASRKVVLYAVEGKPGLFRSEPSILVPIKTFDEVPIKGHPNKSSGDQSILATVGSQITVSYREKYSDKVVFAAQAKVPIRGVLEVQTVIFRDNKGVPITDKEFAMEQVANIQKVLAPAGVRVIGLEPLVLDLPAESESIDIRKELSEEEMEYLAAYAAEFYPSDKQGVKMFITGKEIVAKEPSEAVGMALVDGDVDEDAINSFYIALEGGDTTPGHEFGHLCYLDHYTGPGQETNLMRDGGVHLQVNVDDAAHLTDEQIESILKHYLIQKPDPKLDEPTQSVAAKLTPNQCRI